MKNPGVSRGVYAREDTTGSKPFYFTRRGAWWIEEKQSDEEKKRSNALIPCKCKEISQPRFASSQVTKGRDVRIEEKGGCLLQREGRTTPTRASLLGCLRERKEGADHTEDLCGR